MTPRGPKYSMPKNLKKVQIYPNLVITPLEVNSLTLHNLHYNVLALCKAARPAQIKDKIFNKALRLLSLYLHVYEPNKANNHLFRRQKGLIIFGQYQL